MHIGTSAPIEKGKPKGSKESAFWSEQNDGSSGGLLAWWYRLAAPVEPPNATSRDRERIRTGRLGSLILLITVCFDPSHLPNALNNANRFFLLIVLAAMAINLGALIFNRHGKVMLAGITMVIVVELAFFMVVLTTFHTLSARSLAVFDLMVVPELMAVSLLPPRSVFLAALCNGVFTWAAITFLPRNSTLIITTPASYYLSLIHI